ncbi:MAG TPA: class I adenylate-forming enzyme family protein [Saprospiraceae bacterium]|nr:class I adenylate-forming enzyme family protein [Saprospiraceae bacterium]
MVIANIITHHSRYRPLHPAFIFKDIQWNYKELNNQINKLSHLLLDKGLKKGDSVVSYLPNCAELWLLYWACAKTGMVAVPMSTLLRKEGLEKVLENAECSMLITHKYLIEHIRDVRFPANSIIVVSDNNQNEDEPGFENWSSYPVTEPPAVYIDEQDLYNIIYSSGTTGHPKGIMINHYTRAMYMTLLSNAFRIHPESVIMHSGSIVFNGAFLTLMPSVYQGATYILLENFSELEVFDTLLTQKVTHTILVPSQIIRMLEKAEFRRENLPHLQMILTVGAPLDIRYKKELNERFPFTFHELYGLTEGFVTILDKLHLEQHLHSVGKPPVFSEMKIIDDYGNELAHGKVGEIVGRGPFLMSGYYNDEERTRETFREGWLYTGDLGYVDADGFLYLAGRKKDLIITGGVNVYPKDIEAIALSWDNLLEITVFGIPHEKWGESPVAAVVLKDKKYNKEEIQDWVNSRVHSKFQRISDVLIMDELPRNVAGKVLKKKLQEEYFKKYKL